MNKTWFSLAGAFQCINVLGKKNILQDL